MSSDVTESIEVLLSSAVPAGTHQPSLQLFPHTLGGDEVRDRRHRHRHHQDAPHEIHQEDNLPRLAPVEDIRVEGLWYPGERGEEVEGEEDDDTPGDRAALLLRSLFSRRLGYLQQTLKREKR